jgi:endonuclease/exonuclease/phosphatase family metal-dependent hydrolase
MVSRTKEAPQQRFRVVTYNVHKCRGLDNRVRPDRIVEVLREIDADIVGLQEVISVPWKRKQDDQVRYLADELGLHFAFGEVRQLRGGAYGNLVLTRFPVHGTRHYDISAHGREPRGCLRADVAIGDHLLHVFNIHLGTAFLERRHQARRLFDDRIVTSEDLTGIRLVFGDFNEWVRGLASRLLHAHLESPNVREHLGRSKTYPGVLPFLHLDHVYFDPHLELQGLTLHRARKAMIASDHLPLVADFQIKSPARTGHATSRSA